MYNAYFGFSEKPFNVTSDPRFFCTNAVYQEAYAGLLYGIRERRGFMVMTGEVGIGKTTLLKILMNNLEATVRYVYICQTILTFEELLDFLCEELGLAFRGVRRSQKIQVLNRFCLEQLKKRGTVVLLIDEAQNLDEDLLEHLRLLSNLETTTEKLLQIVLVGQPELEAKLDRPQLRQLKQRVALHRRLERLKDREVGSYIAHRLRAVGYERQDLFTGRTLKRIAHYAQGTPRLINMICDNALLNAYGASRKTVSAAMIDEVALDNRLAEFVPAQGAAQQLAQEQRRHQEASKTKGRELDTRMRRHLARALLGFLVAFALFGTGAAVMRPLPVRERLAHLILQGENFLGIAGERLARLTQKRPAPRADSLPREAEVEKAQPLVEPTEPSLLRLEPQNHSAAEPHGKSGALVGLVEATAEVEGVQETTGERQDQPSNRLPISPSSSAWQNRSIVIPAGATLAKIASIWYGERHIPLAIDLIQEYNPHIESLNLIRAGERLLLPPFLPSTLLREQPDGTYRLIVGAFYTFQEAERLAQRVRRVGYTVRIAPRGDAGALPLFRVELRGLATLEAAQQAWDTAQAERWFVFLDDPRLQEEGPWAKHTRP